MLKQILLRIVVLLVFFCPSKILTHEHLLDSIEEQKYLNEITEKLPPSDQRHQFALAMDKVGSLLLASAKDDFFIAGRIFSVIDPFLDSQDDKIKICSENTLRMVKSGFRLRMMITAPNDASVEEVQQARQEIERDINTFINCYANFLKKGPPYKTVTSRNSSYPV